MKFSIIIAAKNAALHLRRCLTSICSQEYRNHEIIIQDCASEDGTLEILEAFKDRIDLRSERKRGRRSARLTAASRR